MPTPGGYVLCLLQVDLFCTNFRWICFVSTSGGSVLCQPGGSVLCLLQVDRSVL